MQSQLIVKTKYLKSILTGLFKISSLPKFGTKRYLWTLRKSVIFFIGQIFHDIPAGLLVFITTKYPVEKFKYVDFMMYFLF